MVQLIAFAAILFFCKPLVAQTQIGAQRLPAVFDSAGSPYFINEDIMVPAGRELTIKAGAVLLFKDYTGILVEGKLTVEGTLEKPAIFSSINDQRYNKKSAQEANSFDWNGILIEKDAPPASLKHFKLTYSVFGIKSKTPDLTIQNGIFSQNGMCNIMISDKIQPTQPLTPYNYSLRPTTVNSNTGSAQSTSAPVPLIRGKNNTKDIVRFSGLGVGIVGGVVGAVLAVHSNDNANKRDNLSKTGLTPAQAIEASEKWQTYDTDSQNSLTGAIVSFILGGLGLCGFTLTFVF